MALPLPESEHDHEPVWGGGVGHSNGEVTTRFCTTCAHWVRLSEPIPADDFADAMAADLASDYTEELVGATQSTSMVEDAPRGD